MLSPTPSATSKNVFSFQTGLGTLILGVVCLSCDYTLESPTIVSSPIRRAVLDCLTHGLVGLLSWAVVIEAIPPRRVGKLAEILFCGLLASSLDVDHFIAAKTVHLKEALALPYRPPLHSSSLIIVISLALLLIACFAASRRLKALAYTFIVASFSHQIRDGFRRGLSFWPCGTTPPIPYAIYIAAICSLPIIIRLRGVPPLCRSDIDEKEQSEV